MRTTQKVITSIVCGILLTWGFSFAGVKDERPVDGSYSRGLPLYVFSEGSGYEGPTSPSYNFINISINFIVFFTLTYGTLHLVTRKK